MDIVHLDQKQLATRWGISQASLERWRCEGIGPAYLKLKGVVRYRLRDIESYEESCLSTFVRRPLSIGQCTAVDSGK
ncbi:hypothetical protein OYT1_ch1377 [Ferriphaselus amnicola]|uniref:DNA-binding protein n=1 Tax=Ferriphaselus amnicola TaxID=1188319 RepID=A0A2Z6GBU1_9PROT|nr:MULTISPECIES: helix-turn-helix domain-containing protein [Ferriphaselus]BBE50934.1 hypothetical protein OYT1_ch1377 [Ferriphaselus amnicola]